MEQQKGNGDQFAAQRQIEIIAMRNMEEISSSPSIAPAGNYQHDLDELLLASQDRHYALHGQVMMLVLILIFCIFLLFLVFLPCLRRLRSGEGSGTLFSWESCPPLMPMGRKDDSEAQEQKPKEEAGTLLYF